MNIQTAYAVSFFIGTLVGLGELVARYRDSPSSAIRAPGAMVYVVLNGLASLGALWLARTFGATFGADGPRVIPTQALVASFSAIAFFRTSLFVTRVGDTDVGIGPSSLLTALLGAADRSVDRRRASERAQTISSVMTPVSFAKSYSALPTLCLALLQNTTPADQEVLAHAVLALKEADMTDREKSLALGLKLMNFAGPDVLKSAIASLGDEIKA